MNIQKRRIAVTGILLSGCFAAQALRTDQQVPASAALLDQLISAVAVCPELIPSVQDILDTSQGIILQQDAKQALKEAQACFAYRKRLSEQPRLSLAYGALNQLLDTQATSETTENTANSGLKLSLQLGQL